MKDHYEEAAELKKSISSSVITDKGIGYNRQASRLKASNTESTTNISPEISSIKKDDDGKFSKEEWEDITKRYSQEKIKEATRITDEKCTCKKGEVQRKYFKKVLESFKIDTSPTLNENEETNRQAAFDFKAQNGWHELFVKEKYVEAKGFPGKDVSLNMSPRGFLFSLQNLFDSLKRREDSMDTQMQMNY